MDFLVALEKAKDAGFTREEFVRIWEEEIKLKHLNEECKLVEMQRNGEPQMEQEKATPSLDEGKEVNAKIDQLKNEMYKVILDHKVEMLQQNSQHLQEISQLLEHFASLVGTIVKKELDNYCLNQISTNFSGANAGVQQVRASQSSELSVPVMNFDDDSSSMGSNCSLNGKNSFATSSHLWESCSDGLSYNVDSESKKDTTYSQTQNSQQSAKLSGVASRPSREVPLKKAPTEEQKEKKATLGSKPNIRSAKSVIQIIPKKGYCNFFIKGITKIAASKSVQRCPLFHMTDYPCKFQLNLLFDDYLRVTLKVWRLDDSLRNVSTVFRLLGNIQNVDSWFDPLFKAVSKPIRDLDLTRETEIVAKVSLISKHERIMHKPTLGQLKDTKYVLPHCDGISIDWKVEVEVRF